MHLMNSIWAVIVFILFPFLICLFLKRITNLDKLGKKLWLFLFILALITAPLFLFRKHWERNLITFCSNFWFVLTVVQTDNAFWEELAKLLVPLFFIWLFKNKIRQFFKNRKDSLALGYWIGLGYGVGEAAILALIVIYPILGHIFGYYMGMLSYLTWGFFYERFWAIQTHAIMGALIGYGLYHLYARESKKNLILFFILAMLYHTFVDDLVLVVQRFPRIIFLPPLTFWLLMLPILILIGYSIIYLILKFGKEETV